MMSRRDMCRARCLSVGLFCMFGCGEMPVDEDAWETASKDMEHSVPGHTGVIKGKSADILRSAKFSNCNEYEREAVGRAVEMAAEIMREGKKKFRPSSRVFKKWFGNRISRGLFADIRWSSSRVYNVIRRNPFHFDCRSRICEPGYYAFAHRPYKYKRKHKEYYIDICEDFFDAQLIGLESQAGIIIHETSHIEALTQDHEYTYDKCIMLARRNPFKAVENANNYMYFYEEASGAASSEAIAQAMGKTHAAPEHGCSSGSTKVLSGHWALVWSVLLFVLVQYRKRARLGLYSRV